MKRIGYVAAIAALTLAQSLANAQILDLPDPGEVIGGSTGPVATTPAVENQLAGSVSITNISRKTGGELYVVKFNNPQALERLDLRVMSYRLQIHKATLVSTSGQRSDIQTLTNMPILSVDSITSTGVLEEAEIIDSVEFVLESYGGNSQLVVTALGKFQVPEMTASLQAVASVDGAAGQSGATAGVGGGLGGSDNLGTEPGVTNSGSGGWKDGGIVNTDPNAGSSGNINGAGVASGNCTASGFCIDDRVLVPNVGFGYIVAIGTQDKVFIQLDGTSQSSAYSSKSIYRVVLCTSTGICNGQTVSFKGLKVGVVAAVLESDVVYVAEYTNGYYQYFALPKQEIGVLVGCYNNVCQGAKVSYLGSGKRYSVVKVFSNGTVIIAQKKLIGNGPEQVVRASDLY